MNDDPAPKRESRVEVDPEKLREVLERARRARERSQELIQILRRKRDEP